MTPKLMYTTVSGGQDMKVESFQVTVRHRCGHQQTWQIRAEAGGMMDLDPFQQTAQRECPQCLAKEAF